MPALITFDNVSKRYGARAAVAGVSFELQQGEVFGLLGPAGSGKSTLLGMLTGLVRPDSGSVSVGGREVQRNFVGIAARMGVLTRPPSFFEHLTVRRNLLLQGRLAGKPVSVSRVLDWVGLYDAAGARVRRLGPEQRQRLGLALALATEPELLVLDEPARGLDAEASEDVFDLLRRVARNAHVTMLIASRTIAEVEALCGRVGLLNAGRLLACGDTAEVIACDASRVDVLLEGADAAGKRLAEQSWVRQVDVYPGRVHVQLRDRNVHQLCAFLIQAGFKVNGVVPRRQTLREYLLKAANT